MECFLGGEAHKTTIEGQKTNIFIINMLDEFIDQMLEPISLVLGQSFLKMGLRARDRQINRKIQSYNRWGASFMQKKLRNLESLNDQENPKDLIQAILAHNKECELKGHLEDVYSADDLLDEFKIFMVAGTDTTSHLLQMMIYYVSKHPEV